MQPGKGERIEWGRVWKTVKDWEFEQDQEICPGLGTQGPGKLELGADDDLRLSWIEIKIYIKYIRLTII